MKRHEAEALLRSVWSERAGKILQRLEAAGFETWAVGGCVRDALLHKQPSDWDFTSAASPNEIAAVFSDCSVLSIGEKHGTMTVQEQGEGYEITMFRTEEGGDGRHPSCVHRAAELSTDLARRDYTINALAFHPQRGLRDDFGGLADLERRMLRTVGDAPRRFAEDYLRILRGLRFSACLGFSIEEHTAQAMKACCAGMRRLSGERIWQELVRLLCGGGWLDVLREFSSVFGAIGGGWEGWSFLKNRSDALAQTPEDAVLRLALLLWAHPKREEALSRLHLSKAQTQRMDSLWQGADGLQEQTPRDRLWLIRWLARFPAQTRWEDARALLRFFGESCLAKECDALRREGVPLCIGELAIGGQELIGLGISCGPKIGEMLQEALLAVWRGEVVNRKEELTLHALRERSV